MEIKEINHGHYVTLTLTGDLDANSSLLMEEAILQLIDRGVNNLHIDCTSLRYISSAGIGVFISFFEDGGKFVFSDMTESVYRVFELLGLREVFVIVNTTTDAEKAFQP